MTKDTKKKKEKLPIKKVILKSSSGHMFLDLYNGQEISHRRPTVVALTPFVEGLIASGQLSVLVPNLPPEASNIEFLSYLKESDGDTELAVAAYSSKFGINTLGNPDEEASKISKKLLSAAKKAEKEILKDKEEKDK